MLHSNWNFIYTAKVNSIIAIWELLLRFCEADKITNFSQYIQCHLYIKQFCHTEEFCTLNVSILQTYTQIFLTMYTILTCRILARNVQRRLPSARCEQPVFLQLKIELCCENQPSAGCLQAWMLRKAVARHWVTCIKLNKVSCRRKVEDLYTQTWHGGLLSLT